MSDDFSRPTPVDLDGIGRRLHHVRNSIAFGPTSRRLAHTDIPAMMAEIEWSRAQIERLRANQIPDGGEWSIRYGYRVGNAGVMWNNPGFHGKSDDMQRREWRGRPEPIVRDDVPTQPVAAPPVVAAVTRTDPPEGNASGVDRPGRKVDLGASPGQDAVGRYQFAEPNNGCYFPIRRDLPESTRKLREAAGYYGGRLVTQGVAGQHTPDPARTIRIEPRMVVIGRRRSIVADSSITIPVITGDVLVAVVPDGVEPADMPGWTFLHVAPGLVLAYRHTTTADEPEADDA